LEFKRNLAPFLGISRVTKALHMGVCVYLCKYYSFGQPQCLVSVLYPCRNHYYFSKTELKFFLLFVSLSVTKLWNPSSPHGCSVSPAQTHFMTTCSSFSKELKSDCKIFICSNHQKRESGDLTLSVYHMDFSIWTVTFITINREEKSIFKTQFIWLLSSADFKII